MKRETLFSVATIFANALFLTASNAGPFFQTSDSLGLVSIEAENPDARTAALGGHEWLSVEASFAGHSGSDALQALPEDAVSYVTGDLSLSPRLDYQVNFAATGTHYVWVRARAPSLSSRAFHVGLDGQEFGSRKYLRAPVSGGYEWVGAKANGVRSTLNVTTLGIHTVNLWMRDSGTVVDKLVLTTDPDFVPTGFGPAETLDTAASDLVPLLPGFERVSDALWDDTAVRKVLRTFAYGGHATDVQIAAWAAMPPAQAIVEMLTFDEHNLKLSPVGAADTDRLDMRDGTLLGLAQFWASDDPANGVYASHRTRYDLFDGFSDIDTVWARAVTSRGLNPFRQKVGFWETNYHMATNREVVGRRLIAGYYDAIMEAHEQGLPYQDVIGVAAKSAAVASQYGHLNNRYVNGECLCNEDFAREYHQLFFGILGNYDPGLHETVTIKNTAAALTDMWVPRDIVYGGYLNQVIFGTEKHFPGVLDILNVGIGGSDASQRIDELSEYAIDHPESLENLPVMIIRELADDNLTDSKIQAIRMAWGGMSQKNLLDFLRAYAISTLFHDESRIKYWTSIHRHVLIANQVTLNNRENYLDLYTPIAYLHEDVRPFYPVHNVFGGQTGIEAADSAAVFRNNYNRVTAEEWRYRTASLLKFDQIWEKDWASVIPRDENGRYVVWKVAEWLWNHLIGDGLANFGALERLHLYALLARELDFAYLVDPSDPNRVFMASDITADTDLLVLRDQLASDTMKLDSADSSDRLTANQRVGQAINFIVGTPYIFADRGR